jgi:hypothetical protein
MCADGPLSTADVAEWFDALNDSDILDAIARDKADGAL